MPLELLGADPDAKVLAGGHSLVPALKLRIARPSKLIDIGRLSDSPTCVTPALSSRSARSPGTPRSTGIRCCRSTARSCPPPPGKIGDPQVRHRGTIGGSLAHGDPASDLPAVMLALGAEFVVAGTDGERSVAAADFFTGVFETAWARGSC